MTNTISKTQNIRAGYRHTEVGVIPEEWEIMPLGKLGRFKNGINKGKEDFGHGSPFVNLMDVFGIPKLSAGTDFGQVNSSSAERKLYELRGGDVLFVRSSVKPEGVGLTTLVPVDLPDTVFSGFLIRYRDKGQLITEFKEHCFWQSGFRRRLIASSTVSANTNINQYALKALQIAFPRNHNEQRAIANALSDVDALIGALDPLIAKKRDLKRATMQQLLTGNKRLPGFTGQWDEVTAGEIGRFRGGNGFPLRFQGQSEGIYPFYKVSDMNNEGNETFMTASNNWISGFIRKTVGATPFPANSIVFAKVGAAIFLERKKILTQPSCIDNNMAAFVLNADRADCRFIHYLLLDTKLAGLAATTALPSLNGRQLAGLSVALPPLSEQTAIATVLSDMDAELAALELRRDKTRAIKQGMMQELLTGRTRLV